MTKDLIVELCVENLDNALAAERGGADRVELCASLMEGGLTPSLGIVRETLRQLKIPAMVMVRPRGGDFLYSDIEYAAMLEDVRVFREMGCAGVVFGCLKPDGTIDEDRMAELTREARPMQAVCHRAFDMTRDHNEAVEALVRCGVDRVLTSGRHSTALQGMQVLQETIAAAGRRLDVLVCGGIRLHNVAEIVQKSGAAEIHFSAGVEQQSGMVYRNPDVGMGGGTQDREYLLKVTSEDLVRETIAAARR